MESIEHISLPAIEIQKHSGDSAADFAADLLCTLFEVKEVQREETSHQGASDRKSDVLAPAAAAFLLLIMLRLSLCHWVARPWR